MLVHIFRARGRLYLCVDLNTFTKKKKTLAQPEKGFSDQEASYHPCHRQLGQSELWEQEQPRSERGHLPFYLHSIINLISSTTNCVDEGFASPPGWIELLKTPDKEQDAICNNQRYQTTSVKLADSRVVGYRLLASAYVRTSHITLLRTYPACVFPPASNREITVL